MTRSGNAVVAKSISVTGSPSRLLRTAPPTARVVTPFLLRAWKTLTTCGRLSQSAFLSDEGAGARSEEGSAIAPSVDLARLDDAVLNRGRVIDAARLPARELNERGHDDEQHAASCGEQPEQRCALPHACRRHALHRNHIGPVKQKRQREEEDVDQRDAQHRGGHVINRRARDGARAPKHSDARAIKRVAGAQRSPTSAGNRKNEPPLHTPGPSFPPDASASAASS